MKVQQMWWLKRWHVTHRDKAPLENRAWDLVLTLWLLGWMGVPPALLLHSAWAVVLCVPLYLAPPGYVRLRAALHGRGVLRCDWLPLVSSR